MPLLMSRHLQLPLLQDHVNHAHQVLFLHSLVDIDESEEREKLERIQKYEYIGEQGAKHLEGLEKLSEESHLLKHITRNHGEEKVDDIKFVMRVIRYTQVALERQVLKSVQIQEKRTKNAILNAGQSIADVRNGDSRPRWEIMKKKRGERILEELVQKEIKKRRLKKKVKKGG